MCIHMYSSLLTKNVFFFSLMSVKTLNCTMVDKVESMVLIAKGPP